MNRHADAVVLFEHQTVRPSAASARAALEPPGPAPTTITSSRALWLSVKIFAPAVPMCRAG